MSICSRPFLFWGYLNGMTLIPYMAGFIAGTIGWALGKKIGAMYGAIMVSLVVGSLGFYYTRKYLKGLKESMGL